ncbi:MAG: FKBP-type peptidyl-prolyl cis-trans isomerase [Proteobacteria bacterium]|nr:FKBP-type peptidyl-prolyl cis-trans isomerase [Pseudomonadota bacterium]
MIHKNIKLFAVGLGLLWSGFTLAANADLTNKSDRLSYAMGAKTGESFRTHGITVNVQAFAQGLQDALNGNKVQMSSEQIDQELRDFARTASSQYQAKMQQDAQKNQQIGNAFLDANKKRPGVSTTSSGLQYKVLTPGTGPKPSQSDTVTVDYEGRLLDGKVFDSSYERGKPASFPVNAVIMGWQEALQLMPVGSTWEIYIPPNLAYGQQGAGGVIGPNQTLVFKVHLIKTQPGNSNPVNQNQNGKTQAQ